MVPLFPQQTTRWLVAHRGVADRCPENTRAAFELAVAQRADAIECDVQLTADHRVVVCHDSTLDRYGHSGVAIETAKIADLQRLDLGSWFHADFSDQRMLSLDELLEDFGAAIPLCIELKTTEVDVAQMERLVQGVVQAVESQRLQDSVAFLAFDVATLQALNARAPWAQLVLNTHEPQSFGGADFPPQPWLKGVDGNIQQLTGDVVQRLHGDGIASLTFTCNSRDDVLKAWGLGVDAIITNDPERTRKILTHHRAVDHAT